MAINPNGFDKVLPQAEVDKLPPPGVDDAENDYVNIDVIMEGEEVPDSVEVDIGEGGEAGDDEKPIPPDLPFDANLADYLDESDLAKIATDLLDSFESDKSSRSEWETAYKKGLELLGLKIENRSDPWPNACGVYHPVLAEAAVRFQANAIMEIFPASGPVKSQVVGKMSSEKAKQAFRVQEDMNYILTKKMREYRPETEQLLFRLAISGSCFRKIYFDPNLERPVAMMVPGEDFFVPFSESSLTMCERFSHVMRKTPNAVRKMQVSGFYRDVELSPPVTMGDEIKEKEGRVEGREPQATKDDRHTIIEFHVDYDLDDFPDVAADGEPTGVGLPYVITIDRDSTKVLAIRRNWREGDAKKKRRSHFVAYQYLPGLGFYGIGLVHLIGGLTKAVTSLTRQLVDAGTLNNLPAGFKTRGMRIIGDNKPLKPGALRDVDVTSGKIAENIAWMPAKEPSAVLLSLLQSSVEEARRLGSIADVQIAAGASQAPVGTTLAILERSLKVMSGVQARLHYSLTEEFQLLAEVIKDYMPDEYDIDFEGPYRRSEDYSDKVDVCPVSDPNSTTMSQRMLQYQAAVEMGTRAPSAYNLALLHRRALEVLGVEDADQIVPMPEDIGPLDPISENMAILTGRPTKAFLDQDHEAHIRVHLAAMKDPKIAEMVGQSPQASTIQSAALSHISEHLAFQYRREIEKMTGAQLPPPDSPLPPDIEAQLSRVVADAADKLLAKNQSEVQQRQAAEKLKDPVVQMQMRELDLKEKELVNKHTADMEKIKVDREHIASAERVAGAKLGVDIAKDRQTDQRERLIQGTKIGADIAATAEANSIKRKALKAKPRKSEA